MSSIHDLVTSFNSSYTTHNSSYTSSRTTRYTRNTTAISTAFTSTSTGASASDINSDSDSDDESSQRGYSSESQYYYIIVGVGVCLLMLIAWLAYKRRIMVKTMQQQDRQQALAQDAERWRPSRLWQSGASGRDTGGALHPEGLNEQGEAPPPYPRQASVGGLDGQHGAADLVIPLRDLSRRSDQSMKPPDYIQTVVEARGSSSTGDSKEEWQEANARSRAQPD